MRLGVPDTARRGAGSLTATRGVSILEVLVALLVIITLLAISIPGLFTAREASYRAVCMSNQRIIGQAWSLYLDEYSMFPYVPVEPAWRWGGNVAATTSGRPSLDHQRPLYNAIVSISAAEPAHLFCCPADRGIIGEGVAGTGTGSRTACQSFGTSYRANTWLLDARLSGLDTDLRPLKRSEVIVSPSRMVVLGDAFWYEALEQTGRNADWHGDHNSGNLLFLDGSVHTRPVMPRGQLGQAVFNPLETSAVPLPPIAPDDVKKPKHGEANEQNPGGP